MSEPLLSDDDILRFFDPRGGVFSDDAVSIGRRLIAEFAERVATILEPNDESPPAVDTGRIWRRTAYAHAARIVREAGGVK